ncbi:hypothetical protein EII34_09665 [Arachnia propionica]|uniref:DUF7824 domain-containing protein n=1 Tax=Arachnia propionica TaxID=1750 RepID=A0A3P1T5G0_9ACTN|nr:DUF6493 family protein [Arachnia propionica]RRD04564.1 hypothetical protein EII34_09665 [Arachnia propionica]
MTSDWTFERIVTLLEYPHKTKDVVAAIDALTDEERTTLDRAVKKQLPQLRRRSPAAQFRVNLVVLLACLEATPAQLISAFTQFTMGLLPGEPVGYQRLKDRVAARDRDWAAAFVAGVMKKNAIAGGAADMLAPLVIAHELPLPSNPAYLEDWLIHCSAPHPGIRWVEQFTLLTEVRNGLRYHERTTDEQIRDGARALRAAGELDDSLASQLIQVCERGDNRNSQSGALTWLEHLGLNHQLWEQRSRVIAALSAASPKAAGVFLDHCLRPELTDAELTDIAVAVLPRPEKALKLRVLAALQRVTEPDADLLSTVQATSTAKDSTLAAPARALLKAWETTPGATSPQGLWREPNGPGSSRLPEAMPLDEHELRARYLTVSDGETPESIEALLADLIATGHAHGREAAVDALDSTPDEIAWFTGDLDDLLHVALGAKLDYADRRRLVKAGSRTALALRRVQEVIDGLGTLPCLLATPTHRPLHVSWDGLAERVGRYRAAGIAARPVDVTAALARMDRATTPADLSPFDLPIEGTTHTLPDVIAAWRDQPTPPGRLVGEDPESATLEGGETPLLALLDLPHGSRNSDLSPAFEATACPGMPFSATKALRLLADQPGWQVLDALAPALAAASRFEPLLALAVVAIGGNLAKARHENYASLLVDAWDQGRLTPDDLVAAWRNPQLQWFTVRPQRLAEVLDVVAEAGGLALVWPLLNAVAEDLLARRRPPASLRAVLDVLDAHRQEVPEEQDLPEAVTRAMEGRR